MRAFRLFLWQGSVSLTGSIIAIMKREVKAVIAGRILLPVALIIGEYFVWGLGAWGPGSRRPMGL